MPGVKFAFAWCFAVAALLTFWTSIRILPAKMYVDGTDSGPSMAAKATLVVIPLSLSFLFAAAWWTVLKRRDSARKWATAASILIAIIGFLFMYGRPLTLHSRGWVPLAIGIAGLLVFRARKASSRPPRERTMYVPLPGDGTKTIINKLIGAIGTVAAIGGNMLWSQWANSHGLPEALPPGFYLQIVFVISLVLVIHESGHAIAALVLRMKVTSITIGPFLWWTTYGKWRFQFRPAGLKSFLGYISVAPAEIEGFRLRKILQVAAGPFASIVTGLIASAAVITAPASRWQDDWLVFSTFATISLLTGILNLVPFQIGSGYSDGAKLFQLVRGGLWSDYHLLLAMIYATTVTPIRAREFDIATILRAAGTIARGQDQLLMHLCAYSYFLDIDELSQAADALDRAEAFCEGSSVDIPMEWYSVFVFGLATLRRDATRARAWWDRLEAKKGSKLDGMYWSSLSALLWSEGHLEEARDAWEKGDTWARQLPESGFAEAEKNALNILTRAMNETLSTRPNTVGIAAES